VQTKQEKISINVSLLEWQMHFIKWFHNTETLHLQILLNISYWAIMWVLCEKKIYSTQDIAGQCHVLQVLWEPCLHRYTSSALLKCDYVINYRMLLFMELYSCCSIWTPQWFCRFRDTHFIGERWSQCIYFYLGRIYLNGHAVEMVKNRSMTAALELEITSSTEQGLQVATNVPHTHRRSSHL
jgi:hypothetical protein